MSGIAVADANSGGGSAAKGEAAEIACCASENLASDPLAGVETEETTTGSGAVVAGVGDVN